jgi:phosphoenolpyruvate carboxykinase (ATP)
VHHKHLGLPKLSATRSTWADPNAYDAQARKLTSMFSENFAQYLPHVDEDVKLAAIS